MPPEALLSRCFLLTQYKVGTQTPRSRPAQPHRDSGAGPKADQARKGLFRGRDPPL